MADDVFMNFLGIDIDFAAATTTVVEAQVTTGQTPFSNRPWGMSIARTEFDWSNLYNNADDQRLLAALSTQQDLAAVPSLTAKGTIDKFTLDMAIETSGMHNRPGIQIHSFLPTILVAAPTLSLYLVGVVNNAPWQSVTQSMRVGFLTVPMDQNKWNEVAQTWAFS